MLRRPELAFTTLCFCSLFITAAKAEWPEWRGPNSNIIAPPGNYPLEFSPDNNCMWQVELGGEGASTPIVSGGAIYLTTTVDDQDVAVSYDLDGTERWRKALGAARTGKHRNATGSNPSAVTDGQYVVVYFKSGLVACLSTDGEEQWRLNLQDEYGEDTLWWDLGTSPVLTSAGVCIAVIQAGDSYLVTLDMETGAEVWKTRRQYDRPEESDQAYTTPSVVQLGSQETIVTWGADHLTGHDPQTGELLWERDGFNPDDKGMWRVIASATIVDGVAVVPYGRAEYLAAVPLPKAEDNNNASSPARLWSKRGVGADVPCPVIANGKVYVLGDKGELSCLDMETGEILWEGKFPRSKEKYYSSPLLADGKLYCLRADGMLFVASAGDKFQLLAENDMEDMAVATPVPVDSTLLVRTRTKLFRFGQ